MTWLRSHRPTALIAIAVAMFVVLGALRAVSVSHVQAWQVDCVNRGGQVDRQRRVIDHNPVLTQPASPVYRCLSAGGVVLSEYS